MTVVEQASRPPTTMRRIAGQGGLLFAGFGAVQVCSFARNALLGHALSRGDFGVAATIVLILQLAETLSDIGAERLVIQAPESDASRTIAAGHALLAMRGALLAAILFALAGPASAFFRLDDQIGLFQAVALVPLIKGFLHLEQRRRQRHLDNRPHLITEVGAQLFALALTPILIWHHADPSVVIWLALAQAGAAVTLSHITADARYGLSLDMPTLRRMLHVGWPIWLSALPLVAVYQADRALIGRYLGMVELAGYAVAFMITMVPGLIVAKVGNALMLPLLSQVVDRGEALAVRYRAMLEATIALSCAYVAAFIVAGGDILVIAFGPNFAGLGLLVSVLAMMWSLRIVQAVPGMALIALGTTKPLLWAGVARAVALPLALAVLMSGGRVEYVAAAGILGELLSLLIVAGCVSEPTRLTIWATILRMSVIVPATGLSFWAASALPPALSALGQLERVAAAGGVAAGIGLLAIVSMPTLRHWLLAAYRGKASSVS